MSADREFARQWEELRRGTAETVPEDEFAGMLRESVASGVPLRVKCGIDPTTADVHLGHVVPFRKMRRFQDLGHTGVVVVGDVTATIGDPSGRDGSREALGAEEAAENAERCMDQVGPLLLPGRTEVRRQGEWLGGAGLADVVGWAQETTVARLLGHETFRKRLDRGAPLSLHELLYPVLQGIDSVHVRADVELGGTDQRFNVLMGRDYQKTRGMRPQAAVLLPLLTGVCGTRKMGKSLGNAVNVLDAPFDKFGKVMSLPDALMPEYFGLLLGEGPGAFADLHPNEAKKRLASRVVALFHGEEEGRAMRGRFEDVFRKGRAPDDAPVVRAPGGAGLADVLVAAGLAPSKKEARRLVAAGAVGFVGGARLTDPDAPLPPDASGRTIRVGRRRFARLA